MSGATLDQQAGAAGGAMEKPVCSSGSTTGGVLKGVQGTSTSGIQTTKDITSSRDHHVHFDSNSVKDDYDSDSCMTYQRAGDTIVVNLGFLQINHRYLIDLKLPATMFGDMSTPKGVKFQPDVTSVPSLHCRITDFSGLKHDEHDFFEMKVEFFAYKEKLLRETVHIVNSNNSKEILKLLLSARVLGRGKGTPMLRTGIHCIGCEPDPESDASDFEKSK